MCLGGGRLRDECGEIATCAIAAQGDPGGVTVELNRMPGNPLRCGVARFWCGWKFVFAGQRIGHRHDETTSSVRQTAADSILGIQITHDKPTTMQQAENRKWATTFYAGDANWKRAPSAECR